MMLGGMLAGHEESAGDLVEIDGKKFKRFYGMSSSTAMEKYCGGVAEYRASEGKHVLVCAMRFVSEASAEPLPVVRCRYPIGDNWTIRCVKCLAGYAQHAPTSVLSQSKNFLNVPHSYGTFECWRIVVSLLIVCVCVCVF